MINFKTLAASLYNISLLEDDAAEAPSAEGDRGTFASTAAWQAFHLNLTHDGFGHYDDANDNYVARSVKRGDDKVLVRVKNMNPDADKVDTTGKGFDIEDDTEDPSSEYVVKNSTYESLMTDLHDMLKTDPAAVKKWFKRVYTREYVNNPHAYRASALGGKGTKARKGKEVLTPQTWGIKGETGPTRKVPGLAVGGQSGALPKYVVSGHTMVELTRTSDAINPKTRTRDKLYDLTDIAMEAAEEFLEELQAKLQVAEPTPVAKTPQATAPQATAPQATAPQATAPSRKYTNAQKLARLNHYFIEKMDSRLDTYRRLVTGEETSGGTGMGVGREQNSLGRYDKLAAVEAATNDLKAFMENPTDTGLRELIHKYDIGLNTAVKDADKRILFGTLMSLDDTKTENMGGFFAGHTQLDPNDVAMGHKNGMSMHGYLSHVIRSMLTPEEFDALPRHVASKSLLLPSHIFRNEPKITLDHSTTKRGNTTVHSFNGVEYPELFSPDMSDSSVRTYINEAVRLEEQIAKRAPHITGDRLAKIQKDVSDSALLYNDKVKMLSQLGSDTKWVEFDGTSENISKVVTTLIDSLSEIAKDRKNNTLPSDTQAIQNLKLLTEPVDPSLSAEELDAHFNDLWVHHIVNPFRKSDTLRETISSICESLTAVKEMRKGNKVLFPMDTSFQVIDVVSLNSLAGTNINTVDDLIDIEDNIKALYVSVELTSVKSGVSKKDGVVTNSNAPAASGLVNMFALREDINPAYFDFFRNSANNTEETARALYETMLQDEVVMELVHDYYEVSRPTMQDRIKNPSGRRKALESRLLNSAFLGKNEDPLRVFIGKIGEAIFNTGARCLIGNDHFTNSGIEFSDASRQSIGVVYKGKAINGYTSFSYRLENSASPDDLKKASSFDGKFRRTPTFPTNPVKTRKTKATLK